MTYDDFPHGCVTLIVKQRLWDSQQAPLTSAQRTELREAFDELTKRVNAALEAPKGH